MDIRQQFPDVQWIWKGGISFVYEVHPHIVVKVPKSDGFERTISERTQTLRNIFPAFALPFHNAVFLLRG
jgi:hypothetical protein